MSSLNIFRRKTNPAPEQPSQPGDPGQAVSNHLTGLPQFGQLDRMQLTANRFLRGTGIGVRPSTRRRATAEFREHRKYVPGDDVRFVDWKASARQEQIFLKQGENPRDTSVAILLDCSASMAWGDPPRWRAALGLASILGYLALAHGDRLTVVPLGAPGDKRLAPKLGPVSGKGQFPTLLNYLQSLPFGGDAAWGDEIQKFAHTTGTGGLVYLLSDLWEAETLGAGLAELPAPKWHVTLFHLLHTEELEPTLKGDLELVDVETGEKANYDIDARAVAAYKERLQAWLKQVEQTCLDNRVLYARLPSDASLDHLLPQLRLLGVIEFTR